jgi:hypothetical protein
VYSLQYALMSLLSASVECYVLQAKHCYVATWLTMLICNGCAVPYNVVSSMNTLLVIARLVGAAERTNSLQLVSSHTPCTM